MTQDDTLVCLPQQAQRATLKVSLLRTCEHPSSVMTVDMNLCDTTTSVEVSRCGACDQPMVIVSQVVDYPRGGCA